MAKKTDSIAIMRSELIDVDSFPIVVRTRRRNIGRHFCGQGAHGQ